MKIFVISIHITILLFVLDIIPAFSQTSNQINLQKYWFYRHRLKDFVVVGDCQGCSLPSDKQNKHLQDAFANMKQLLAEQQKEIALLKQQMQDNH